MRKSDRLYEVCEEFCANRVHRIVVMEPGTGNVLYLLTLKRVLQAIHKQVRGGALGDVLRIALCTSRSG